MDPDPIIDVKDLNYQVNGFHLKKISFSIHRGERFALTGPNGSGKTTLLRLLVRLLKPRSGTIKILGKELNKKTEWEIRKNIGFLFQNPADQLFSPTVWEDVAFGPRNLKLPEEEVEEVVQWALDAVDMGPFKNKSPFELSWGQKKRIALAGILAMKPQILFLDEPFANLDFPHTAKLIKTLEKLWAEHNMTFLFTSHERFFIENWADQMLFLNSGSRIFLGSPKEGLKHPRVARGLGDWGRLQLELRKSK